MGDDGWRGLGDRLHHDAFVDHVIGSSAAYSDRDALLRRLLRDLPNRNGLDNVTNRVGIGTHHDVTITREAPNYTL